MSRTLTMLWLAVFLVSGVSGHGRMNQPAGRSTAFRIDRTYFVENNDDHGLYCGGFGVQHNNINQGRCGICGDEWSLPRPRPNERSGSYYTGNIVAQYVRGGIADVVIDLTVNHRGQFSFDVCPSNSPTEWEQESCFIPLYEAGTGRRSIPVRQDGRPAFYNITLQLPAEVICTNCVFRWIYQTGNSWGVDANGNQCTGCGNVQEYFYSCADVMITNSGAEPVPEWVPLSELSRPPFPNPTPAPTAPSTTRPTTTTPTTPPTTTTPTTTTPTTTTSTTTTPTTTTSTTTTPTTTTSTTPTTTTSTTTTPTTTTPTTTSPTTPTTTTSISSTSTSNVSIKADLCNSYCKPVCNDVFWYMCYRRICEGCGEEITKYIKL